MNQLTLFASVLMSSFGSAIAIAQDSSAIPVDFEKLPEQKELPDPLKALDGKPVASPEEWATKRRPEIAALFSHHMYGYAPPPPERVAFETVHEDATYFQGRATKKLVNISIDGIESSPIQLLLVVPNKRSAPAPVFLGLNFAGNHTVLYDLDIPLTPHWVRRGKDNRATGESRGTAAGRWEIAKAVTRGYAIATVYQADIDPDYADWSNGIQPHFYAEGQKEPAPHEWGTLRAWAWGLHRCVDYLVTDPDIDADRIAVMGHSRNGKAALVAGAYDERIALVVSNQSGCGGAALSRRRMGETVKVINKNFPHWFCGNFKKFDDHEDKLPFDQHMLVSLIAPRPVLVCSAEQDKWADPEGEFGAVLGADPVYRLLGTEGLKQKAYPGNLQLIDSILGYHVRPGGHAVGAADWKVFMDFADKHMPAK